MKLVDKSDNTLVELYNKINVEYENRIYELVNYIKELSVNIDKPAVLEEITVASERIVIYKRITEAILNNITKLQIKPFIELSKQGKLLANFEFIIESKIKDNSRNIVNEVSKIINDSSLLYIMINTGINKEDIK